MYFGGLEHPKAVEQGAAAEKQTPSPRSPLTPPVKFRGNPTETPPMSPPPRITKRAGSLSEGGPGLAGPSTISAPTLRPPTSSSRSQGAGRHHSQTQPQASSSRLPMINTPSGSADPRTLGNLSGEWSGTFHEIPPPLPSSSSYRPQHRPGSTHPASQAQHMVASGSSSTSSSSSPTPTGPQGPFYGQVPAQGSNLDDRWVSFMNYDVLRDSGQQQQRPPQ